MSSFKRILDYEDEIEEIEKPDESDVITLRENAGVIKVQGIRYRKLNLELEGYHRQDLACHYLFDLKYCRKTYYKSHWYYEIKEHSCKLGCVDSGLGDKK